jgi:hypothetical protein
VYIPALYQSRFLLFSVQCPHRYTPQALAGEIALELFGVALKHRSVMVSLSSAAHDFLSLTISS